MVFTPGVNKTEPANTPPMHDKPGGFTAQESASEAAQRTTQDVRAAAEAVENLEKVAERATFAPQSCQP